MQDNSGHVTSDQIHLVPFNFIFVFLFTISRKPEPDPQVGNIVRKHSLFTGTNLGQDHSHMGDPPGTGWMGEREVGWWVRKSLI